jgi:hypothetical protein
LKEGENLKGILAVAFLLGILLIPVVMAEQLPPITLVRFDQIVMALPVGVDIKYPSGVANDAPVAIFTSLPQVSSLPSDPSDYPVTIAYVYCGDKRYVAIPVADNSAATGVKWYLVMGYDLIPLSQLNVQIGFIEIPRIVVSEFSNVLLLLIFVLSTALLMRFKRKTS